MLTEKQRKAAKRIGYPEDPVFFQQPFHAVDLQTGKQVNVGADGTISEPGVFDEAEESASPKKPTTPLPVKGAKVEDNGDN